MKSLECSVESTLHLSDTELHSRGGELAMIVFTVNREGGKRREKHDRNSQAVNRQQQESNRQAGS